MMKKILLLYFVCFGCYAYAQHNKNDDSLITCAIVAQQDSVIQIRNRCYSPENVIVPIECKKITANDILALKDGVYIPRSRRTVLYSDRQKEKEPLFLSTTLIKTIGTNELRQLPQRNINSVAGTVAGVDSRAGETPYIRGARPENTAYYIDGMRVSFLTDDDMCISMLK